MIRRETDYTRALLVKSQLQVDDLRDNITRRKEVLELAQLRLQDSWQYLMNGLKGRNKVKRKEWKALFDKLTSERKRIVSASLLVHGIKPCEPRRGHPPPRAQNFEIGGLPVPALFSLREYRTEHVNHVFGLLAQCLLLLSNYLGMKLPYELQMASSSCPSIAIWNCSDGRKMTLALSDNKSDPSDALACLAVNVQFLCHSQGVRMVPEEANLVKMIFGLLGSDTIGQSSDDTAFALTQAKGMPKAEGQERLWDRPRLADRISVDLTNDPFEFVDLQNSRSSKSSLVDSHM